MGMVSEEVVGDIYGSVTKTCAVCSTIIYLCAVKVACAFCLLLQKFFVVFFGDILVCVCLLYTSDAADDC